MLAPEILSTQIPTAALYVDGFINYVPMWGSHSPTLVGDGQIQNSKPRSWATNSILNTASNVEFATNGYGTFAIDQALVRLRRFKTWGDNWDGEGGKAPQPAIIDRAIDLLSLLAQESLTFSVGLDADARPMFNLRDSSFEGHILVDDNETLSFFFVRGESEIHDDYDFFFDGCRLPPELKKVLALL